MTDVLTTIGAVVLGATLAWTKGYVDYLSQTKRGLYVAALECRDRLAKIQYAFEQLPAAVRQRYAELPRDRPWSVGGQRIASKDWRRKTIDDELSHLGTNLDRYLESIAPVRSARLRRNHLGLYERMRPILIAHDLSGLGQAMSDLDEELERDWPLVSQGRVQRLRRRLLYGPRADWGGGAPGTGS